MLNYCHFIVISAEKRALIDETFTYGATKTREWKTQKHQNDGWKSRHQKAGVENAGETSMESQNFRSLTLLSSQALD